MKSFNLSRLSLLALVLIGSFIYLPAAWSQTKIGNNLDEITKLAEQEGQVRIASALESDEVPLVFKGFYEKYPKIKVEPSRIRGSDSRERIFTEALGGVVENDLADISSEVQARFVKAGVLAGPFPWRKLYPNINDVQLSPNGYFVAVGWSNHIIAYNPSLVPADRVPKKWQDCLDPYWKGRFVVDTRPKTLADLAVAWGEEKTLQYAAKLKSNQPVWKRGQTESLTQMAAGEYPMICGSYYQSVNKILRRDPKAKVAVSFPNETPVAVSETLAVLKGAQNPNAAILLAGWLASPEGQKGYDKIGRGSPYVEGTETWKLVHKAGAKLVMRGWEDNSSEEAITKKILGVWGLAGKSR